MEENTKNTGHGMGVAALIMGIISMVVAFIPCVGLLAFFTGVVAVVLGAIGISQASRASASKGLGVGGLVTGGLALLISIFQVVFFAGFSHNLKGLGDRIEEAVEDVRKDVMDDIESGDFRITIEDGEDKIEIKGSGSKKNMLDELDKLEGVDSTGTSTAKDSTGQ